MKRDMDLVREILLHIEETLPYGQQVVVEMKGRSQAEVAYHLGLLHAAGFLQAVDVSSQTSDNWIVLGLTWEGHDFLDAARDSKTWTKAKETFREKGLGMPFDVLKALLVKLITGAVLGGTA